MEIRWRDSAEADMAAIVDYLVERDIQGAYRVFRAIREQVDQLVEYPALGRTGRLAGTRELTVPRTPYIVAYTIDFQLDTIFVLRVLHGTRRWPERL